MKFLQYKEFFSKCRYIEVIWEVNKALNVVFIGGLSYLFQQVRAKLTFLRQGDLELYELKFVKEVPLYTHEVKYELSPV